MFLIIVELNSYVWTTIFSFGKITKESSLVLTLVFNVLFRFVEYWSSDRLIWTGEITKCYYFNDYVEKLLGKKLRYVLQFFQLVFCYGTLVQYICTIYTLIGRFVYCAFYSSAFHSLENFNYEMWSHLKHKFPIVLLIAVLISVSSIIKKLSKYMAVSIVSLSFTLLDVLVVIIQTPSSYKSFKSGKELAAVDGEKEPELSPNWFGMSSVFGKDRWK